METFTCCVCKQTISSPGPWATGYCLRENGGKVCYACCAVLDLTRLALDGNDTRVTLYLRKKMDRSFYVANWPNSLRIPVESFRHGRHNLAGTRTDVWFTVGRRKWHGVNYGHNTQIVHCKRLKG